MKLKNKIHIYSTLLMLVILVILMLIIYFSFSRLAYSTEVSQLQTETETLLTTLNANESTDPSDVLRAYVPQGGLVRVTDGAGEVLTSVHQDPAVTAAFPENPKGKSGTVASGGERFAYAKTPVIWTDGQVTELTMAKSMNEVTGNLATLRLVLLAAIFLAMIPVTVSSMVLGRIVTQPINDLTKTMDRIQRNGQFEKLPVTGKSQDELTQMGITFNKMISLLEENYSKQEEFVSNASHELKTPLTVIRSYARLLQRQGMEDEAVAREGLDAIQAESERMKSLMEELLHIARRNETQIEWSKADIVKILEGTVSLLSKSYDRNFELKAEEPVIEITTDAAKLKQLLYILLDNARKYSEERIEVSARQDGDTVIQIRDYGIGIPKEALPYVFDRFYRVDKARSRETGGFGLGLSLAKQLADAMGIKLEIDSIENLGTTVSVIFSSDSNVPELQSKQEGL